jgi:phage gpG-like protein
VSFEFDIKDNSEEVKKAMQDNIARALEAVGLQAEGDVKLQCPVDTGLLRNSITHTVAGENFTHDYTADKPDKSGEIKSGRISGSVGSEGEPAVYVGTNVEYAAYVEYGHSLPSGGQVPPQKYLQQAIENNADTYKKIIEKALKGEL